MTALSPYSRIEWIAARRCQHGHVGGFTHNIIYSGFKGHDLELCFNCGLVRDENGRELLHPGYWRNGTVGIFKGYAFKLLHFREAISA